MNFSLSGWSCPPVLVVPSPDVDRLSQKNGLTFAELLKPFGCSILTNYNSIPVQVQIRTPTKQLSLKQFGLKFIASHECTSIDGRYSDRVLDAILAANPPPKSRETDGIRDESDVPSFLRVTQDCTPWYARYMNHLLEHVRYDSVQLLDQPVAMLVAVSSNDKDEHVTKLIDNLRQMKSLPNMFQTGIYDSSQLTRAIVVVHDRHTESNDPIARDRAAALVSKLARLHGDMVCKMIEINSLALHHPNISQKDIWSDSLLRGRMVVEYVKNGFVENAVAVPEGGKDGGDDPYSNELLVSTVNEFGKDEAEADIRNLAKQTPPDGIASFVAQNLLTASQSAAPKGAYLAQSDFDSINSFIADLTQRLLVPALNARINMLSEKVNTLRKGIKNSIMKSIFGRRSDRAKASVNLATNTYDLASTESLCRQLADLLFVCGDYDGAASYYRLCLGDYKADKMYRYLANCYEMIGLCGCGLSLSGSLDHSAVKDIQGMFEAAQLTWASMNEWRNVSRVAYLASECYKISGQLPARLSDSISLFDRASSGDNSVRSALLCERSAYLNLQFTPPSVRKYAFSLVLAGFIYHKYFALTHGVRCYASASVVYDDRRWEQIDDHIHHNLGRDYFKLNNYSSAIQYFVQLIGRPRNTSSNQLDLIKTREHEEIFLRELIFIVQQWSGQERREVPGLRLPLIVDESVKVESDGVTVSACYVTGVWNASIRNHRLTMNSDVCNRPLFAPSLALFKETERGSVEGERIFVCVDITNPLQIELQIKNLKLKARHIFEDDTVVTTTTHNSEKQLNEELVAPSQDICLAPNEKRTIQLPILPSRSGMLHIEGMTWEVCEILLGFHRFSLPPKQVYSSNRRGPPVLQPDLSLSIPIWIGMPCLSVSVNGLPSRMVHGEVIQCAMRLSNTGSSPLSKLVLRLSHPGFVLIGIPRNKTVNNINNGNPVSSLHSSMSHPSLSAVHSTNFGSDDSLQCYAHNWSDSTIDLGLNLLPGETITMPMWIRAVNEGSHSLGWLFRYEPSVPTLGFPLKFRLSYFSHKLTVAPLFSVRVFQKPSFADVRDFLLGIEITDKQNDTATPFTVGICRINVMSKSWMISELGTHPSQTQLEHIRKPISASTSVLLKPSESVILYFRITSLPVLATASIAELATCPTIHACVSKGSSQVGYDCSILPYSAMLGVEKSILMEEERQQLIVNPAAEIADVGSPNRLDLIIEWTEQEIDKSNDDQIRPSINSLRNGFHHSIGLTVMKILPTACPLKAHLSYPSQVSHSFDQAPVLSVPVTVYIRNSLEEGSLTLTCESLAAEEEFNSTKRTFVTHNSSIIRGRFVWRGNTKCRINNLEHQQYTAVRMIADFTASGVYNLNRFRFTLEVGAGKKPRIFFFPLQHLIRIHNQKSDNLSEVTSDQVESWTTLREE